MNNNRFNIFTRPTMMIMVKEEKNNTITEVKRFLKRTDSYSVQLGFWGDFYFNLVCGFPLDFLFAHYLVYEASYPFTSLTSYLGSLGVSDRWKELWPREIPRYAADTTGQNDGWRVGWYSSYCAQSLDRLHPPYYTLDWYVMFMIFFFSTVRSSRRDTL